MEEGRITPRRASNSPPVPSGIRVLVVDDDSVSLLTVKKMLISCKYRVCGCNSAAIALKMLQELPHAYDIVLTDIHMPKMDGFRLLGRIGKESDLPVIMLSVDKQPNIAARGLADGASLFLTKPASMDDLRNIWQYVMRRRRNKEMVVGEQSGRILDKGEEEQVLREESEEENESLDEDNRRKACKRKMDEKEVESVEEKFRKEKKPRVVWTPALHAEFLKAIQQLGYHKAVPNTILDVMNIPGLTRDNVASHLQKFRQHLRRVSRGEDQNDHSSSLHLDSASSGSLPFDKPTTPMNFFPQQLHNTRNLNLLKQYRRPSSPIHRPIADIPIGNTGYSLPANKFTSQPYPYFNFSSMGGNTGTPQCQNLLSTVGASKLNIDPNNTENLNLEVRMRLPPTPPFGLFNLGVGGNRMGSSGRGTSYQSSYNGFRNSCNGFHLQDHDRVGRVRGEASNSTSQAARIPAWLNGDQNNGKGV